MTSDGTLYSTEFLFYKTAVALRVRLLRLTAVLHSLLLPTSAGDRYVRGAPEENVSVFLVLSFRADVLYVLISTSRQAAAAK